GARTINISTAAALVAAAAGAAVAKHGNRAVSSASGSADVLEALGFSLELEPARIERSIDELGFGFLFAPTHHPAMRYAAPVRKELATRTVFNVLGPLTNPAGARAQVVGVYSEQLVRTIAEVLARLGARRAFVVHGAGGIDELSPVGPNLVAEVVEGSVRERTLDPEAELGLPRCSVEELRGGTPGRTPPPCGRCSPAPTADAATRSCSTRPARLPPPATQKIFVRASSSRATRSTRAPRRSGSTNLSPFPARLRSPDGTIPRRPCSAGPPRDRGGQAPLSLGRLPAPRRRSRTARSAVRECGRRRRLGPRRRGFRRLDRRPQRRPRRDGGAVARERVLHRGARPAQGQGRRRGCRLAPAAGRRRSTCGRAALVCPRAGHRATGRSARRERASPCGCARRRGDRRQRARPLDVRDRPPHAARADHAAA